jgi:hypothetical protein
MAVVELDDCGRRDRAELEATKRHVLRQTFSYRA